MNGERFYLLQDQSALKQHDETHLFKVGIDGNKLAGDLDEALELLPRLTSVATRIRPLVWSGIPTSWVETPS